MKKFKLLPIEFLPLGMKNFLIIILLLAFSLSLALPTSAQLPEDSSQPTTGLSGKLKASIDRMGLELRSGDPETILGNVIKALLSFLAVLFFILIVYAGALWMMSGGNEHKVSTAKNMLLAAIIGVMIVMVSYLITVFILTLLKT